MREDISLKEAIDLCESFGLVVIDKESIKKLSFSFAERKGALSEKSWLPQEELDREHEEKALRSIFQELKQSGTIRKTVRDGMDIDGVPSMQITTWSLRVLE